MEFHKKLQELRKNKGLTQEELAEALYVSRTAISKWEQGRGYPNIDSLKEISNYFSVSIDELLSGEKLITIAEKENKNNINNLCDLLFGIIDIFSFLLILLPIYPNAIDGFIYSVNLLSYTETTSLNLITYWIMFSTLILIGILKIFLTKKEIKKPNNILTFFSISISIIMVLFLALSREAYAIVLAFLLLVIKIMLLIKNIKLG